MLEAYVLHAVAYKDTSLMIKFFTKEQGVIKLIANGAKRPKSQFFGILQPFVPLLLYYKHYNQDLATLYKAEAAAAPYRLFSNYLFGALYINELLIRLLVPHESNIELFTCYENFLIKINEASKLFKSTQRCDPLFLQQNLRFLEKKILKAMGYELQLNIESHSGDLVIPEELYYFDIDHGLKKFMPYSSELAKNFIKGSILLALHHDQFIDFAEMQQAKLFMRNILAHFLGDQPLAVRKLFI